MKVLILNGPNLNLLGKRQPEIYGSQSFESYFEELVAEFEDHELIYFQTNHEGVLIDKIQEAGFELDAIVINAGGYTHTSIALGDALAAVPCAKVEVHISDIHQREDFRHHSYLSAHCEKVIIGKGLPGYRLALTYLTAKA